MILETKYSIGDKVFYATTTRETKHAPCPDCLGTKKWKAVSPAGMEYEIDCPRCSANYLLDNDLTLAYEIYTGAVVSLTIGQVKIDTKNLGAEYMCLETGICSGSVYNERDLFSNKSEAAEAADILAAKRNKDNPHLVSHYNKVVALKDYQISDAKAKAANLELNKYRWEVQDFVEELERCVSLEEVQQKIRDREW